MRTPKIGDLYQPKNPPASIPGKRKYWGEITDVIEDGHGGYLVEVDYGVEKGDFRNIFVENYEQPKDKQPDMNTSNPIQFLDFTQRSKSVASINPNEAVIYRRNKSTNNTFQIRLPYKVKPILDEGYVYVRVAVNNLTNEVFFVFDKTEGMKIMIDNSKSSFVRISCRDFIVWLEDRFNLPKNGGGVVVFSDNLSREEGYTFKVEPKRD